MTFDPKRTKIIPELLSNKHQAQFYDADLGMWVDLGDAKDTRAEAQAILDERKQRVPAGDVREGAVILWEAPNAREYPLTVKAIEPTGSVKFGTRGPNAIPILRFTLEGMPAPFKGLMEVAADNVLRVRT